MKRFKDNKNGTVTDNETRLMWVKDGSSAGCNNGDTLTWEQAKLFCKKLEFAGHKNWRLPNVNELQSIVDYGRYNPVINPVFTNTKSSYYWSATTYVNSAAPAWGVDFSDGLVYYGSKAYYYYVRPVRGGQ